MLPGRVRAMLLTAATLLNLVLLLAPPQLPLVLILMSTVAMASFMNIALISPLYIP